MAGFGRLVSPGSCTNLLNSRCLSMNSYQFISSKTKKFVEDSLFPNKPKRPLTPFFRYMKEIRPRVVSEYPGHKSNEIVKLISQRWASEDPGYKFKLNKEYDIEYKEYMNKIVEYEKTITPEQREHYIMTKKNLNKKKDKQATQLPGKPKKPPSAFILYMLHVKSTQQSTVNNREFLKMLSIQWKTLNEQDKKQFVDQAASLMEQYNKDKIEWEQKMMKETYQNMSSFSQTFENPSQREEIK
ncbi:PREDICTED: transcription factor A, mitochondrial [Polistes dominula]|uniref:Transcription factor A, mitochondrial n=1 Tax=Polistes dominula TaxID=743375 RepID=A0ABM1I245_POLDO|nr:PREDICTED: transcription factor A, mitochondrial [Polistes dominula]